jgi:hypothetical protein
MQRHGGRYKNEIDQREREKLHAEYLWLHQLPQHNEERFPFFVCCENNNNNTLLQETANKGIEIQLHLTLLAVKSSTFGPRKKGNKKNSQTITFELVKEKLCLSFWLKNNSTNNRASENGEIFISSVLSSERKSH